MRTTDWHLLTLEEVNVVKLEPFQTRLYAVENVLIVLHQERESRNPVCDAPSC